MFSLIASSIPLYHSALKSLIFKCAEFLMAVFVYKFLSLCAARSNQFTSYLMFSEDYIQRWMFMYSRGASRATSILVAFSLLSVLASLYGTLLWALDSPGYIFRALNATVADYQHLRNLDPPYIVQLHLDPDSLQESEKTLAQTVAIDLFKPGLNYTLTGKVDMGSRQVTKPKRQEGTGPRIWLDDDGFSVSTDMYTPYPTVKVNETFPSCTKTGADFMAWNCTFNNTFALSFAQTIAGQPEVHWDDESDLEYDSRYIKPNRVDNIWNSYGAGGGSALMMQVFTVTKGQRRHSFVQSTLRLSMLTGPGIPFDKDEVMDFMKRSWSFNETERDDPFIATITSSVIKAQDDNVSWHSGGSNLSNDNKTVFQSAWNYLTAVGKNNDDHIYSLITVTATNITLLRSETIKTPPTPLESCQYGSWQNEAFGGKVTQTDCAASVNVARNRHFFGQVDTSAVMITYGLGHGRSNLSAESLNENVTSWIWKNSDKMADLLIARGFIASVDPALVTIQVDKLTVAMSGLQLLLTILAFLLAAAAWLGLAFFSEAQWSNTFLSNMVHTTWDTEDGKPGYMRYPPEIGVTSNMEKMMVMIAGRHVVLQNGVNGGVYESIQGFKDDEHKMRDVAQVTESAERGFLVQRAM